MVSRRAVRSRLVVAMRPAASAENGYVRSLVRELGEAGVEVLEWDDAGCYRADVAHVHWPEQAASRSSLARSFLASVRLLARCALMRRSGARLVWTAHNLHPHENPHPRLMRVHMAIFTAMVDGWILPREAIRRPCSERWPSLSKKPSDVIPLGHYRDLNRFESAEEPAWLIEALDPARRASGAVALVFGPVRPYKGVATALDVADHLGDLVHLLVVGKVDHRTSEALTTRARAMSNVTLIDRYVGDKVVPAILAAVDVQLLPYERVTNSSGALLGLSFGVPVVSTENEAISELQAEVGEDWVRSSDSVSGLAAAVLDAANHAPTGTPSLALHDWDRLVTSTINLYRRLSVERGQARP